MDDYFVKWDSSLKMGIEKIDEEHELIIEYVNQLYDFIIKNKKSNEFRLVFANIYHIFLEHIMNEELFMQSIKYPLIEEHKIKHENFLTSLNEMKDKLESWEENVAMDIFNLLSEWLINHLLIEDKKLVKFHLNSKMEFR